MATKATKKKATVKEDQSVEETDYMKQTDPWMGLTLTEPGLRLEDCLAKMVKEFPKLPNFKTVVDTIIGYRRYMEDQGEKPKDNIYSEEVLIISPEVFTVRCVCGACRFLLEYNCTPDEDDLEDDVDEHEQVEEFKFDSAEPAAESAAEPAESTTTKKHKTGRMVAGFTLSNMINGESVFVQNIGKYTKAQWEELDDQIFTITD